MQGHGRYPRYGNSGAAFFLAAITVVVWATDGLAQDWRKIGLSCAIAAEKQYSTDRRVSVRFQFRNASRNTLSISKRFTPLETAVAETVTLKLDGKLVPYRGILSKRLPPTEKDYLLLKGGQEVDQIYDLSANYDLSRPGVYKISFNSRAMDVREERRALEKFQAREQLDRPTPDFSCKPATFTMVPGQKAALRLVREGGIFAGEQESLAKFAKTALAEVPASAALAKTKNPAYVKCTENQQKTVKTAHVSAHKGSIKSYNYVGNNNQTRTWFGAYDAGRYGTVKSNYRKINTALGRDTITYFCKPAGCRPNTFAYTYKNSRRIYLCSAFWTAPSTGWDTKPGTIVHELTHAVALTDDIVYGTSAAKNLAKIAPDRAIKNADNHEYFTESGGFFKSSVRPISSTVGTRNRPPRAICLHDIFALPVGGAPDRPHKGAAEEYI